MQHLVQIYTQFPNLFLTILAVLGLMVGSFLNVVIHRLPKMLETQWRMQCVDLLNITTNETQSESFNLVFPNSHCPNCKDEIRPWHNIPLISYVFLQGKCAFCKTTISLRYPIIEFICGFLTTLTAYHIGMGWPLIAALFLLWSLIALTVIDFDTQLLPDDITLPLMWLGLIVNSFGVFCSPQEALYGTAIGYLSLWSIYWLFKLLTGKEGMGYGDFKLLAALGAWMGWQMLPLIILLSSLVGAVVGISLIIFTKHQASKPIPFGPYLACAGFIALLWGHTIVNQYLLLLHVP